MRRRSLLTILAGVNALIAALLGIAINTATSSLLPEFLHQHPGRAWTLFGVLTVVAVACGVAAAWSGQSGEPEKPGGDVRVGGVHAGRDVNIGGQGHTVVGGDHVSITPQRDPAAYVRRRRRR